MGKIDGSDVGPKDGITGRDPTKLRKELTGNSTETKYR
jgi:hypothetical protein